MPKRNLLFRATKLLPLIFCLGAACTPYSLLSAQLLSAKTQELLKNSQARVTEAERLSEAYTKLVYMSQQQNNRVIQDDTLRVLDGMKWQFEATILSLGNLGIVYRQFEALISAYSGQSTIDDKVTLEKELKKALCTFAAGAKSAVECKNDIVDIFLGDYDPVFEKDKDSARREAARALLQDWSASDTSKSKLAVYNKLLRHAVGRARKSVEAARKNFVDVVTVDEYFSELSNVHIRPADSVSSPVGGESFRKPLNPTTKKPVQVGVQFDIDIAISGLHKEFEQILVGLDSVAEQHREYARDKPFNIATIQLALKKLVVLGIDNGPAIASALKAALFPS